MSDVTLSPVSEDTNHVRRMTEETETQIAPLPRISIQAFCESGEVARLIEEAAADRRMTKTITKIQMGGIEAAIEAFRDSPTPNLIIIETNDRRENLFRQLELLATFCDSGTNVVVIGDENPC